jgi:hypothetical protein
MNARIWFAVAVATLVIGAVAYTDLSEQPTGRVLWRADAESPAVQEWASLRAQPEGRGTCSDSSPAYYPTARIARSSTVVAQGRYSYAITLAHGDRCYGERAELAQGNPDRAGFENRLFQPGDDRYISFQVYLARDFDVNATGWRLIAQLHQQAGLGTPPLSLDVEAGRFVLYRSGNNSDSSDTVPLWSAPATNGRWVRFTLHVKFSADPKQGLVELWGNPAGGPVVRLLDPTPTFTMKTDQSGRTVPDHARIGIFRNEHARFGTETAYYDGFTVATTRRAAEDSAFGGG